VCGCVGVGGGEVEGGVFEGGEVGGEEGEVGFRVAVGCVYMCVCVCL
jgi:hypothetical protein